jgi:peptide chain release factor 1
MHPGIEQKLQSICTRHKTLEEALGDPEVTQDMKRYEALGKEAAQLASIAAAYEDYQATQAAWDDATALAEDSDPDMRAMAEAETRDLKQQLTEQADALALMLIPKDPDDTHNIYLEIRAGTGGAEAALFAADLQRMYARFAEEKGWRIEILSEHASEQGGLKAISQKVSGKGVYGHLKYESGIHRVQRIPSTESQGRIHTSACTVAVLPELTEVEHIAIRPDELKVDTFRSSGAGGQHVNTTDSAIRITHLPTGTVVECQDERSQHKNRAKALAHLQSKLLSDQRAAQQKEQSDLRRAQVGSGDRSGRIRTYNFPQSRVTDHRIQTTWHQLPAILEGHLQEVLDALIQHDHAAKLAALKDDHSD